MNVVKDSFLHFLSRVILFGRFGESNSGLGFPHLLRTNLGSDFPLSVTSHFASSLSVTRLIVVRIPWCKNDELTLVQEMPDYS